MEHTFKIGDTVVAITDDAYRLKKGETGVITSISEDGQFIRVNGLQFGSFKNNFELVAPKPYKVGDILVHIMEDAGIQRLRPGSPSNHYVVTHVNKGGFRIDGIENMVRSLSYDWTDASKFRFAKKPVAAEELVVGNKITVEATITRVGPTTCSITVCGRNIVVERALLENKNPEVKAVAAPIEKPYTPKVGDVVTWGSETSDHKILWMDEKSILVEMPDAAPLIIRRSGNVFKKRN